VLIVRARMAGRNAGRRRMRHAPGVELRSWQPCFREKDYTATRGGGARGRFEHEVFRD